MVCKFAPTCTSVVVYAPIAYGFLKSNKNTTTAINDRVVVCNPRIESGYPGIVPHQAPYLMTVQTSRDPKSHAHHRRCCTHQYARRPARLLILLRSSSQRLSGMCSLLSQYQTYLLWFIHIHLLLCLYIPSRIHHIPCAISSTQHRPHNNCQLSSDSDDPPRSWHGVWKSRSCD